MNAFRIAQAATLALGFVVSGRVFPAAEAASSSPVPADNTPASTVNHLHSNLTDAMTHAAKLGCEGRSKLLAPVVDASFNLPFIAERALRRHWKTLDDSQHAAFTQALRASFIGTYATEFSKANSLRFETGKTDTLANGDAVVHAQLLPTGGEAVSLDYVMKTQNGHWQIVNVLAQGVSDLALRATQYDGIIKNEGFPALLVKLDAQTLAQKAHCP